MISQCKLCKKKAELANSHVMPKFLYRFMRKYQDKTNNINGLLSTNNKGDKLDVTQRQWKEKLFCHDCEELLSKNETKMAKIFRDINTKNSDERKKVFGMSGLSKINKEEFKKKFFKEKGYTIFDHEIDKVIEETYITDDVKNTLSYFCISYILRQLYIVENTLSADIFSNLEKYLLKETDLNLKVIIKINSGNDMKIMASSLCLDGLEEYKHYNFVIPEIWFHLIIDIKDNFKTEQVIVTPEDFYEDEHVLPFFLNTLKGVKLTEKAKKAFQQI